MKKLFIIAFLFIANHFLNAQCAHGFVYDYCTGQPLNGVNLYSTNRGCTIFMDHETTNNYGYYEICNPASDANCRENWNVKCSNDGLFIAPNQIDPSTGYTFPWNYNGVSNNNFYVHNPSTPNFKLNEKEGSILGYSQPFNQYGNQEGLQKIYKCTSDNPFTIQNLSSFQNLITEYKFTLFRSDAQGNLGVQVQNTGFQTTFPTSSNVKDLFPLQPDGNYYRLRLEIKNACGIINKQTDAWIQWNISALPYNNAFTINNWDANNNYGFIPNQTTQPGALCGASSIGIASDLTNVSPDFYEYRIKVYECDQNGNSTGVGTVYDVVKNATEFPIHSTTLSGLIGGQQTQFYSRYNEFVPKQFKMEVSIHNPCGWSTAFSYFKLKPNCIRCKTSHNTGSQVVNEKSEKSILSDNDNDFEIFPNPTSDFIYLHSSSPLNGKLEILDINGKCVINRNIIDINRVNVSNLTSGVYILNYSDQNINISKKFIKQN